MDVTSVDNTKNPSIDQIKVKTDIKEAENKISLKSPLLKQHEELKINQKGIIEHFHQYILNKFCFLHSLI